MSTTDPDELRMLGDSLRTAMLSCTGSGQKLDAALSDLGWREMLDEIPGLAIPLVFRLLGETGAHAPVLNDVVLRAMSFDAGGTVALPFTAGWVVWERTDGPTSAVDGELPIHPAARGEAPAPAALAAGRRALGWWLVGSSRAMLALARQHAVDRVQFGRRISSFQAIRHRLAETLVALEGAEATLQAADGADALASALAKAAAGQAALTAARHCQQVLGGVGFTAEHQLHRHIKRSLILDGLLGSARDLTREAGKALLANGSAPRLIQL